MVLIATADPRLRDALLRLAAAADIPAEVARTAESAYAAWRTARLALVGADLAGPLAALQPVRRAGVVLVAFDGSASDPYRQAVEIGAQDVAVLPGWEPCLVELLGAAGEPARGRCVTVCLVGGRGGAGTSVLCAVLGLVAARRGHRTLVIDGDPLGGGLDLVLGVEQVAGARWPAFLGVRGRLNATAMHACLPGLGRGGPPHDLSVLSWGRGTPTTSSSGGRAIGGSAPSGADPSADPWSAAGSAADDDAAGFESSAGDRLDVGAAGSVLEAATRGFDLVVVDLPRWLGPVAVAALPIADASFLLVPAEVRATVAAEQIAAELARHGAATRLIVAGPAPGGLSTREVATALRLPLAGELALDRRIQRAAETGALPAAIRRSSTAALCDRLLQDLAAGRRPARTAA